MKKILSLSIATTFLLLGCATSSEVVSLELRLQNPLFAERYGEELVEALVELKIQNHPLLEDASKEKYVDKERGKWLSIAKKGRKIQNRGTKGYMVSLGSYAKGEALFVDSVLYFGTDIIITPSPSLHVYLTTSVDPRDVEFPEETSIDLGELHSAYGAQSYNVPEMKDSSLYRTVVLWDTQLEYLIGFVQLRGI